MKDFLLLIIGGCILVAVFGDGGLTISPEISPELQAKLDVNYAPDRSVTTIENQTTIDTNIERQQTTVIYQTAPVQSSSGVSLVDMGQGRCAVQPGDLIEQEQGNGACFVWNGNKKYFINPNGNRWEIDATGQTPPTTGVLLSPDTPKTLEEFQAAFLRNGGELPMFWNLRSDDDKVKWLTQQEETWR